MNEIETAWVAGLLEGEGCFSLRNAKASKVKLLQVSCGMTDEDTIRKLHRIIGFGNVHVARRCDPRRSNAKLIYTWACARRNLTVPLLEAVRPHMGLRRGARIDEMLQYALDHPLYAPAPYEHGTTRTYAKGCRCDPCRTANTNYCRGLKNGIRLSNNPDFDRMPRVV